ncbi:hypothetical protein [Spirosoma fluviale]|uniref:hypothetical protein n=1 Tax=Spirosoma fluviale TaxID=1597977 RepID=UPI001181972C|nr:hypothetical protein [Spirosoma fluviale]
MMNSLMAITEFIGQWYEFIGRCPMLMIMPRRGEVPRSNIALKGRYHQHGASPYEFVPLPPPYAIVVHGT